MKQNRQMMIETSSSNFKGGKRIYRSSEARPAKETVEMDRQNYKNNYIFK